MKKVFLVSICLVLFFESCYKEAILFDGEPNNVLELPLILKINNKNCAFDSKSNTLRYAIEYDFIADFEALIEFQNHSKIYFKDSLLINNSINDLGSIEINKNYTIYIITDEVENEINLQFTNLPIIQIITHNTIIDEPKTLARLLINYPSLTEDVVESYIGIEHKGYSSQWHEKKSFLFSFLNSQYIHDNVAKSIFNLPENSEWWLDAMFIDHARLRNKTCFEIWQQIEGGRNYGIHSNFVELFINSEHQGVYCLNEQMNNQLLNMIFDDALLYKAVAWDGTTFTVYEETMSTNKYWNNWEQKFPNPEDKINWEPLMYLTNVVVNYEDDAFILEINELINIENFIDYYIFINMVSAADNTGKNTFLGRKSQEEPLFIVPWDLDASFGRFWNGSMLGYTDIHSNSLYDRLLELDPNNFKNKLKNRWLELRVNILSPDNLMDLFETNFNQLQKSNILDIENTKWGLHTNLTEEQEYINSWINNRINFLDTYYQEL